MVAFLGMLALSVDVAGWYQTQRNAQSTADAAALAAANYMSSSTGTVVSNEPAATSVAITYAADNGLTITSANVSYGTASVTVTVPTTASTHFSGLFGINNPKVSATSVASWTVGSTGCTTAEQSAGQCYAIYAANATCGTSNGFTTTEASETITGGVHSQGSLNITDGDYSFQDPITYSSGNCSYTKAGNATEPLSTPTAGGNQVAGYWPQNYASFFTACTSTCTGPSGTPSYCTDAAASYSFNYSSSPTGIYCAYGTGTKSEPSTWNGTFTFGNGADIGSSSSYKALTLIGGSISASSSEVYIKAATGADNCVMYMLDTDAAAGGTAVSIANGNYGWSGDIFAPNGTISVNSSSSTGTFLEALNVNITNLSFTGDGPTYPGGGATPTSGGDALTG